MKKKKRILLLITERSGPRDKNWDFFENALAQELPKDVSLTMGELVRLTFEVDENGDRIYDREKGFSLDEFDLVIFRFIRREFARAAACASFLKARGIPYSDEQIQPGHWSKYSSLVMRYHAGLPPIPSVFSISSELEYMFTNDRMPFGYPIVIKDVNGRKGRLNFIVHNKQEATTVLQENPDCSLIVQKFIENDGDYRFLVMGDEVKMGIFRRANEGSHLNNTSQGATATLANLAAVESAVIKDALLAASLERLQLAGVDIMFDARTNQHYVIEVNSSPQLATGAFPGQKMKAYADYLVQRVHE